MACLWLADELTAATGGTFNFEQPVFGLSIDTRSVNPGDLFIALRATRDGHDFVAEAMARGAGAAMVDHRPDGITASAPLLEVTDTLQGLTALGAAGRGRSTGKILCVTGSVGKTTTKELLRTIFGVFGEVHASTASFNNHWGVPLTLASIPPSAHFAVAEIGMNHRGEIAPLSRLARPHVAIITTIAPAHIGHLGSLDAIAAEKADISVGLERGGILVLPGDSPSLGTMAAASPGARHILFGEGTSADVRLTDWEGTAESSVARITVGGTSLQFELGAPGKHLALNACAALAAAHALGLDLTIAAASLRRFLPGAGRGGRLRVPVAGGTILLLDDSYNASTASIRAGLAVLVAQPAKRRLVALGDMRELGHHGPALHRDLAPDAAAAADLVFCCGPLMANLYKALPPDKRGGYAEDSDALALMVAASVRPDDAILIKGSLGSRMKAVVSALGG